jgi:hypothetical protein
MQSACLKGARKRHALYLTTSSARSAKSRSCVVQSGELLRLEMSGPPTEAASFTN